MNRACFFAGAILLFLGPFASAGEKSILSRIVFGSCARQDKPQPIWDAIVAAKPELYLALGDNIYGDSRDMDVLKRKYDQLAAVPGFQRLKKSCPILATWDDHDYGMNDAGADYPLKDASQQLFLDFWGVAKDSPRRTQKGVYSAALFGPSDKRVQIIMLDTRYFRSKLKKKPGKAPPGESGYEANTDPAATILGEAQWAWLGEQLKVPARLRFLVSSIQIVAQDHSHEKWMNFPLERERLFKLLKDTKAAGLIALSGDRHLAELSMMDAGLGYPLYDLTSSGLTEASPRWRKLEVNRHRVATMNWGNNFGVVTIDWTLSDPVVRLQIRNEAGEVTIQEKLPLSLLQPGSMKSKGFVGVVRVNDKLFTPALLKELLNKEVTLRMKVAATGQARSGGLIFLNSAADFRSEANFTIVLNKDAQESLAKAGITQPRSHFEGKAIRVVGTLSTYNGRPQIIVSAAQSIELTK